ncbi:MAG: ATP-binding protein [Acidimicrobiales bacterium]|nr:ATP-binding protein [Acidimicrobiales bacterium]
MDKPEHLFDRVHEWGALASFIGASGPGSALGLVYGRRRQGKTYLLQSLAEQLGGLYWTALSQSSAQNLQRLAAEYTAFSGQRAPARFDDWAQAFTALLALGEGRSSPIPVVVDEFPYLLDGDRAIPSTLQALLAPRGEAVRSWRTSLILCGSALSTMQGLLASSAPLRGRASLELVVHPFGYRDAARFWGVSSRPATAFRLHALVGGTPAYRAMAGGSTPGEGPAFDRWVQDALLDPASAMFREGQALLADEIRPTDRSVYTAVLAAIAGGRTRRGEIAAAVGRAEGALAHPLNALVSARLVEPAADALRQKRTTFQLAEPMLRFHQLVIEPHEPQLARRRAGAVWAALAETVSSRIYGPHFEHLARVWCLEHAGDATLGGPAVRVGSTTVACRTHRSSHDVDVVVLRTAGQGTDRRHIAAVGEAKWRTEPCDVTHLDRLDHLCELLGAVDGTRRLLFSRAGFTRGLRAASRRRGDVELIDLDRLYHGS